MKKWTKLTFVGGDLLPGYSIGIPDNLASISIDKFLEESWYPFTIKELNEPFDTFYNNLIKNSTNNGSKKYLIKHRKKFLSYFQSELLSELMVDPFYKEMKGNRELLKAKLNRIVNYQFFFVNLTINGLFGNLEGLKGLIKRKEQMSGAKHKKSDVKHYTGIKKIYKEKQPISWKQAAIKYKDEHSLNWDERAIKNKAEAARRYGRTSSK